MVIGFGPGKSKFTLKTISYQAFYKIVFATGNIIIVFQNRNPRPQGQVLQVRINRGFLGGLNNSGISRVNEIFSEKLKRYRRLR